MSFPRDKFLQAGCLIIFFFFNSANLYIDDMGVFYPSLHLEQAPTGLRMLKTEMYSNADTDHRRTRASRGAR